MHPRQRCPARSGYPILHAVYAPQTIQSACRLFALVVLDVNYFLFLGTPIKCATLTQVATAHPSRLMVGVLVMRIYWVQLHI